MNRALTPLVQIASLCLKSGNAVLLKGGSEASHTNRILAEIITAAGKKAGLPDGWLALLETRADVAEMLAMDEYIDLIIPRGSNAFVKHIMDNTRIAVLGMRTASATSTSTARPMPAWRYVWPWTANANMWPCAMPLKPY